MKQTNKEIEAIKQKIVTTLKKNNVKKAGIFGSYARGDQTKNSDIDILVEFNGSLLDLIALEIELQKKIKKKIDLLTYNGLSPYLSKHILNEEIRIV